MTSITGILLLLVYRSCTYFVSSILKRFMVWFFFFLISNSNCSYSRAQLSWKLSCQMSEQLIKKTSQVVKAPVNLPSPTVTVWARGSTVPTFHLARRMAPAGVRWTSVDMGSSQCWGSPEQKSPVFFWTQGLGGGREGKGWEWKSSEYWVREEKSVLEISHSSDLGSGTWGRPQVKRGAWAGNEGVYRSMAGPGPGSLVQSPWRPWCMGCAPSLGCEVRG